MKGWIRMAENIISFAEFNKLDKEQQKETILKLKDSIGATAVIEAWGISRSKFYNLLNKLNIPKGKNKETEEPAFNSDKLYLVFNAEFTGDQITKKLALLNELVSNNSTYKVKIEIVEK